MCECTCSLPLDGQLLIRGLLNINDDFFVHPRSQFEALLVFVFCNGTVQRERSKEVKDRLEKTGAEAP